MIKENMTASRYIDLTDLGKAIIISCGVFFSTLFVLQAYASTVTLSVIVNTSLTFTSSTNNFTSITPGTAVYATTTLSVTTNDANGWNVTLSGDNKGTGTNNLQTAGNQFSIPDQTEWVPGGATTTAGNATTTVHMLNSGNVLAFRVMSASSTNGVPFLSTNWWGPDDTVSNALWAGIASSSVQRQIGNAGTGSYSSSSHLNSVQYYLNVATTQQTGTYNAPITYTATGN